LGDARWAVANRLVGGEVADADENRRVVGHASGWGNPAGVCLDRADPRRLEDAEGQPPMRGGRGDVVGSRIDDAKGGEDWYPVGDADGHYDGAPAWNAACHQNQLRTPNTKRTPLVLSPARRANEAVWPNLPS